MAIEAELARMLEDVRAHGPLVHCITNYVTVESCANAVLAIGASPIMTDEAEDVEDIVSICGALDLNIGTLNARTIESMRIAGSKATEAGTPIVLDPVGAGASRLRTATASGLLDDLGISVVRGNMSEVKALAGASTSTKGVDANPLDAVTEDTLAEAAAFACDFARRAGCVVAITGAIDVVADEARAFAVFNGSPLQGRITGAGCMLSAVCGAYAADHRDDTLVATLAAIVHMGIAGQMASERMGEKDGTGSFHTYLMDALSTLDGAAMRDRAFVREIARG
ncbi:hydroxyethylthiazole kinase [Slackia sp. CM382]|uniref:hydroxyethylthiazole kinase n=1 Tax=Slackia sp. CM382 TaxID=1111137 RepID=UPI0002E63209|nr:hydroxyethylthiazole kinase [Slackia sp. CM382]